MTRNPSMKPTIVCVPARRVPPSPSDIHLHGMHGPAHKVFGHHPQRCLEEESGIRRLGISRSASGNSDVPLRRPSASSSSGKKARNMLKAMAWLSVTQSGKIRPNARARFVRILCIAIGPELYGKPGNSRSLFRAAGLCPLPARCRSALARRSTPQSKLPAK